MPHGTAFSGLFPKLSSQIFIKTREKLRLALDARTGHEVYRFNTGGSIGGGVVTYAVGGMQYVSVASGSPSNFWVDEYPGAPTVVIFALPRE
jgi:alcohol dehydrogenase (cytochrome c)